MKNSRLRLEEADALDPCLTGVEDVGFRGGARWDTGCSMSFMDKEFSESVCSADFILKFR